VSGDLRTHIAQRASQVGLSIEPVVVDKLAAYVELLTRWNKTVNLTALALDPPTDDAIDRLLIEPLVAAARIEARDRLAVDVGSGGGSPAIPMKIAAPGLRMILVESRFKKAAFLREVVRHLELTGVDVENRRLEELATRVDLQGQADIVTLRAVTPTVELWGSIEKLLQPGGRVFWFGGRPEPLASPAVVREATMETIPTPPNSQLSILQLQTGR
jgi:16S rRNA (guanine527-N7)-methyltransferase